MLTQKTFNTVTYGILVPKSELFTNTMLEKASFHHLSYVYNIFNI